MHGNEGVTYNNEGNVIKGVRKSNAPQDYSDDYIVDQICKGTKAEDIVKRNFCRPEYSTIKQSSSNSLYSTSRLLASQLLALGVENA